ncbi:hypothetical protein FKM82_007031 [Ascaphus truei]
MPLPGRRLLIGCYNAQTRTDASWLLGLGSTWALRAEYRLRPLGNRRATYADKMAAKVAKGSVRKAKPVVAKTSLNKPYDIVWNTVVGEDMQFILQTLLEKFKQLGLKKIEIPTKERKSRKAKPKGSVDVKDTETEKICDAADDCKAIQKETEAKPGWTHCDLRKQLAIGINEVTRSLEKNELYFVLVCKSAKPAMLTNHLIELSASRDVPACQLPRLSENIAPVLGLKSVLALGFRRDSDVFLEEVKAVMPRVPPLNVPWLQSGAKKAAADADLALDQDLETPDASSSKPAKSLKRKHQKSEAKVDSTESSTVKLQGLKVKKIVPNPNKIRKIKKKSSASKK